MTKTQFRSVVGGSIALLFIAIAVSMTVDQPLPAELDGWLAATADEPWGVFEWLAIALAVGCLVASVGLLFLARWARPAFAVTLAGVTATTLFTGPSVTNALDAFFYEVTLLLDGFILALAYFSDARHYFAPQLKKCSG